MSSDNPKKTVAMLCDDARLLIAEFLPPIASSLGAKVLGANGEVSLPHLKPFVDFAEFLNVGAVEKRGKTAEEGSEEQTKTEPQTVAGYLQERVAQVKAEAKQKA